MSNAFDYLKYLRDNIFLPYLPPPAKYPPSNSELWRWLEKGSVQINGKLPLPKDRIDMPINQLIFFPKGKRRTTYLDGPACI